MKILNVLIIAIVASWLIIHPREERWQLWVMGTEERQQTHTANLPMEGSMGGVPECAANEILIWDVGVGYWECGLDVDVGNDRELGDLTAFPCTAGPVSVLTLQ